MKLEIIVVPYDVDSTDTGMARSPRRVLELGFVDRLEEAGFEVVESAVWARVEGNRTEVTASVGRQTARAVAKAASRGRFPLVLSGGCLAAVGIANGLQRMGRNFGTVWVDAHGDFNTPETSPSGYWDGMALAALCGRSLAEIYKAVELRPLTFHHVVHLGGRAFDPPELEDFQRLGIPLIAASDVGDEAVAATIAKRFASVPDLYLHLDLDALDPSVAPAVCLPEKDGIDPPALVAFARRLPRPCAMTLSGMSFDEVDEKTAQRQIATTAEIVSQVLSDRPPL